MSSRARVGVGVDRDGPAVTLHLRQAGRAVTLELARRGAAVLGSNLSTACAADDDIELECDLVGHLQVKEA